MIPQDNQDSNKSINFEGDIQQLVFQLLEKGNILGDFKQDDRNIKIRQGNYNESIAGNYIDKTRSINISDNATVNASGAGTFNLGDISCTVANTINHLPNFEHEPDKKKLKELLRQLHNAVLEAEFDDEDQKESLELVQAIASSLTNSPDGAVKKTAKRAMKMLRGTAAALPPGAAMVTICNQLPDLISKIF